MKLVFFGYGELGATVLEGLLGQHDVRLVVTHPADFTGLAEPEVAELVDRYGLSCYISSRASEAELAKLIDEVAPEAIVSTNWRTRLPVHVLGLPRLGALNVHDALLPAYSGFGAVNWAIRNGEEETGVTVHLMEEQLDVGPVIVQHRVPISVSDTASDVYRSVTAQYVPATLAALARLAAGERGTPQDPTRRTFYHRIGERDTRIDWRLGTADLHNFIRGQSDPYVNAWTTHAGVRLFIKSAARPVTAFCGTPGRVIAEAEGGVAVACGPPRHPDARGIILLDVQPEGGAQLPAREYFSSMGAYLD